MAADSKQCSEWHFQAEDSFCARMQAQCEEIRAYQQQVMRSGERTLSLDQAAEEWIARYAESFSAQWHNHQP
ncbi:hypothetical protein DWB85_16870 [Seongchinamella sediminis]|uniref:Uncharacterized protein n=1 Tax=Seongchinamella sediminis TaxID=2283635 RepID=A0A3L7DUX1_9GAMM|nr:hypothetical protein [Seongchinamella sediminis]RLQ20575.1 hypothetical protein DWB85_16870 [Seongchinamella sediminis]